MLSRIKAPAGLSIGTSSAQEIAVSILAEIIQVKKGNVPHSSPDRRRSEPATVSERCRLILSAV